ncbi:MAG: 2-oxo-4-hydroxy-4-carboxy-5-ureidoimidazoline decarboxylase [Stenomitos frigidus ULC029]
MSYSIAQLNQMSQDAFVATLGAVFEATPTIAREAWAQRPFTDSTDLYEAMVNVVNAMTQAERLTLIRAHPDLGSKAKMAEASVQEQAGAGLDQLMAEEYDRLHALNQAYQEKFGFPFIITVKQHTKASILEAFDRRLHHTPDVEVNQALAEIIQIARLRLAALLTDA